MTHTPPKELIVVDGFNILYRAFHGGGKHLSAPNGALTGAIHGFLKSLHMLEEQIPNSAVIITLDRIPEDRLNDSEKRQASNIALPWSIGPMDELPRSALYPGYKAHRSAMPDELKDQILPLVLILHAYGYPILQGNSVYEADDVLTALADRALELGIPVTMFSGDKDVLAKVKNGPVRCRVYSPNDNTFYDEQGVFDKMQVRPDQITDFLTLMGDAVDGIPGVDRCGKGTAAKWLATYNTLDELIKHADDIKGVVGENLRKAIPLLPTARALAQLRSDIPLPITQWLGPRKMDRDLLEHLLTALNMKSELKHMQSLPTFYTSTDISP